MFIRFCFLCPPIQPVRKARLWARFSFNCVNEEGAQREGAGYNKDRFRQQPTLHPFEIKSVNWKDAAGALSTMYQHEYKSRISLICIHVDTYKDERNL